MARGSWGPRSLFALCGVSGLIVTGLVVAPAVSASSPSTWYAYPEGAASAPTACPRSALVAQQCTLSQALRLARAGDTVALAVSGDESHPSTLYPGGSSLRTPGTSDAAPVTIAPASGVHGPILDGSGAHRVLYIGPGVHAVIDNVTIEHGYAGFGGGVMLGDRAGLTAIRATFTHNTARYSAGAIISGYGGTGSVTLTRSTFTDNSAVFSGGAIISGYKGGVGELAVARSTFTGNSVTKGGGAGGGAILSGFRGIGVLTVTGSTFADNSARLEGGAIASGEQGFATTSVAGSTFAGNTATDGAAIDSGENGSDFLTVSRSTFSDNVAGADGGAIDSGEFSGGNSTAAVIRSTFTGNAAGENGGAIDSGDGGGAGVATVTRSTFTGNTAGVDGGAIDSGDYTGTGRLTAIGSTFTANSAGVNGDTIDSGDDRGTSTATVGANVFDGSCHQASVTWGDLGYNTASDTSCFASPAAIGDDDSAGSGLGALLGALTDNGGPTKTVALLASNPAIVAIPPGTAGSRTRLCPVSADQRRVASPAGGGCDVGAVQLAGQTVAFTSVPPAHARVGGTYRPTAEATSGLPAAISIDPATPPGVCSISGGLVSFTGVGICVIDADQGGDNDTGVGNWVAAATARQSVRVVPEERVRR